MTWQEGLEIVIARTGNPQFRVMCSDENRNIVQRDAYRRSVIQQAGGSPRAMPAYPSLVTQAGNAIEAAKRLASAWWRGEPTTVDADEVARRLAICLECPSYDSTQGRCMRCGCWAKWKNRLASEHCPIPENEGGPRW